MTDGMRLSGGTIVDATLIAAPHSTKSEEKTRDPEMHQVKKGNQWHFGMKVHVGTDSQSGLIHRARIEHPFLTLKRLWGFAKLRYRRLAKNTNRAFAMLAMLNICTWGRPLTGEVHLA